MVPQMALEASCAKGEDAVLHMPVCTPVCVCAHMQALYLSKRYKVKCSWL